MNRSSVSRLLVGILAVGALLAASTVLVSTVSAASTPVLVFISAPQTVAPASNSDASPAPSSGSVILQTQNGNGVPLVQSAPLTVALSSGSTSGGASVSTMPSSITIPTDASSASFTFVANSTDTSAIGYFIITASANGYSPVEQTESVEPTGGDTTVVVQPGNPQGASSVSPVQIGATVDYFAGGVTESYVQAGTSAASFEVTGVEGVVPGGGGAVSGQDACVTIPAGSRAELPEPIRFSSSTIRPPGTYVVSFLVSEFANQTSCSGPASAYYDGTSQLEILPASAYTALAPQRILDTRTQGGSGLGPNQTLDLTVVGGSVPASASAVAINVTVTDTTQASFLSVYPAGTTRPLISNLNWTAGETIPNLVVVPVGTGGSITFYNLAGQVQVVVDLEGYYAPESSGSSSGSYVPLTPSRIVDTRPNSGFQDAGDTLGPDGTLTFSVAGEGRVPTSGTSAAVLNVTVTDTTDPSYLTVYPAGDSQPLASNLNWTASETVANRVMVPLGSNGEVTVFNLQGNADVVVDVDGYVTDGTDTLPAGATLYEPISPVRVLDTRSTGQTLGPQSTLVQAFVGIDGIATNATAVAANVTVTDTTAGSFLTVFPGGTGVTPPLASDLNWIPGETVPNLTLVALDSSGSASFYNDAGTTQLVVDVFGYFLPFD